MSAEIKSMAEQTSADLEISKDSSFDTKSIKFDYRFKSQRHDDSLEGIHFEFDTGKEKLDAISSSELITVLESKLDRIKTELSKPGYVFSIVIIEKCKETEPFKKEITDFESLCSFIKMLKQSNRRNIQSFLS